MFKKLKLLQPSRGTWITGLILLVVVLTGGILAVRQLAKQKAVEETQTPAWQMQPVRRGTLSVTASGDGALIPADEENLSFASEGIITGINVRVGDTVQSGDLLAEIKSTAAKIQYIQANRELKELTSVTAIAAAKQDMAAAWDELKTAQETLEYLISPNVYYWEKLVASAEQKAAEARAEAEKTPEDEELQLAYEEARYKLDYAQDSLTGAWESWEEYYLPENFTDRSTGKKYLNTPTEAQILEARGAIIQAETVYNEAVSLYKTLTGEEIPEDATGSGLSALENARFTLEAAQKTWDGNRIYAPFDGTVMAVNAIVGDAAENGTTIITIADISEPYLELYLDETYWGSVETGYAVQARFDLLPGRVFTGMVIEKDPKLYTSFSSAYVRAIARLDNTGGNFNLPIGIYAEVEVSGGQVENALLVPVEALHQDDYGNSFVYLFKDGQPTKTVIQTGIQNNLYAEITSGLQQGDMVILDNIDLPQSND
ncbi:MAG: efflux RND transporter periplasmic adaptor subunit [Anaerolineales bacterium]|nr:efflux RND transporter periplasmic adaptor subunit [Anaerolineales bacterium]